MKHLFTTLAASFLLISAINAQADPEEDRTILLEHYRQTFPNIKLENYVYGALSMNNDAKSQYDEIMSFPPFSGDVRQGGVQWEKSFANGEKFDSCFKNDGVYAAAHYPYFDDKLGKVVTFENAINNCLKKNGEPEIPYASQEMAILTSYARSLSDGARVRIKVNGPAALAAYEKGKAIYFARNGQLNFSCATCHVDYAGKFVRSEQLSMMIGQASHWPEFRSGTEPTTLQGRYAQCQKNVRAKPFAFNSTEYNDLEYFMTYMSNGLKMLTPVFRK
jgi:sulfur-oxidizing protein SoxA